MDADWITYFSRRLLFVISVCYSIFVHYRSEPTRKVSDFFINLINKRILFARIQKRSIYNRKKTLCKITYFHYFACLIIVSSFTARVYCLGPNIYMQRRPVQRILFFIRIKFVHHNKKFLF